jgi:nitrogen regulatory protein PII-like uncharacterized protein
MMTAYFDDSGTHRESEIAVAACFVSDVRSWANFESEWVSVLDEAGIRHCGFHMAEFVAHKPPFDQWNKEQYQEIIESLINVINKNVHAGLATAVVKADYDSFVIGKLREKLGTNHYTFAVQSCLAYIEEWRNRTGLRQLIRYVFDFEHGKAKHEIANLFNDIIARKLAFNFGIEPEGFSFERREQIIPLQAADILAWEAYRYMRDHQFTGKDPRQSFRRIIDGVCGGICARYFDKSSLPKLVADTTEKYEAFNWDGPLGGFVP